MDTLADPMADLKNLYAQYAASVELASLSRPAEVEYWAPAPPPLTLAGRS